MKLLGSLFCFGLGAGAVSLGAMDLQTLVDRSPFAPPASAAASAGVSDQPGTLEFRSVVTDEQGVSYSIFDATANKGYWLRESGGDGPIRFKSYNAQETQIEVEQGGKSVKLQLKRSATPAGAAIAIATPRPANTGPQQGGGQRTASADPAADARRLESVAAEVRRRRALRNAASNPPAAATAGAQPAATTASGAPAIPPPPTQ